MNKVLQCCNGARELSDAHGTYNKRPGIYDPDTWFYNFWNDAHLNRLVFLICHKERDGLRKEKFYNYNSMWRMLGYRYTNFSSIDVIQVEKQIVVSNLT